MYYLYK